MTTLQRQTQAHYDTNPFIEGGLNRIAWWRDYLRVDLPDELVRGRLIVDVGSSVGEISRGLLDRGARVTCLDLSRNSLLRCRQINPEAALVHGSALSLPFADGAFDHAISIGVLHHTPDCRRGFKEVARVTAPGGTVVVFLYNFWNIYNPIYHAFWPIRKLVPLDRVPRVLLRALQPFAVGHLGQRLSERELRNLLGDKLWTPRATFHSVGEVRRWAAEEGLTYASHRRFFLGYAIVSRFVKRGTLAETPRPAVRYRCVACGASPLVPGDEAASCPRCGRRYPIRDGILEALGDEAGPRP